MEEAAALGPTERLVGQTAPEATGTTIKERGREKLYRATHGGRSTSQCTPNPMVAIMRGARSF